MGITQLIDPFYRDLDSKTFRRNFENGQIAWVPTAFTPDIPRIMEVQRLDPSDHFAAKFELKQMTDQHFRKRDKLPIKLLNLGETEELFVTQCKLRPAIVLLPSGVLFEDLSKRLRQMGKGQFEKEVLGVIPYTAFRRKTPTRASPK